MFPNDGAQTSKQQHLVFRNWTPNQNEIQHSNNYNNQPTDAHDVNQRQHTIHILTTRDIGVLVSDVEIKDLQDNNDGNKKPLYNTMQNSAITTRSQSSISILKKVSKYIDRIREEYSS